MSKDMVVLAVPYKNFKEKINLTKKYLNSYKIEDFGRYLYMEKRFNSNGGKFNGKI